MRYKELRISITKSHYKLGLFTTSYAFVFLNVPFKALKERSLTIFTKTFEPPQPPLTHREFSLLISATLW